MLQIAVIELVEHIWETIPPMLQHQQHFLQMVVVLLAEWAMETLGPLEAQGVVLGVQPLLQVIKQTL
jgi:hypothetical protein